MPRRRGRLDRLFRNRVHDRLGWRALRPKIQNASQEHTRVEKGYGHRFRSSSTSAAMSTPVRASLGTVGRATVRRPTFTRRGPGATRCRRIPNSSAETSSSAPALNPILSRTAAGITTRPALSMVVRMVIEYHRCPGIRGPGSGIRPDRSPPNLTDIKQIVRNERIPDPGPRIPDR